MMGSGSGAHRVTRTAKVVVDALWWLSLLAGLGFAVWLLLSPVLMRGEDGWGDVAVPVSIGAGAPRRMLSLETADSVVARSPAIVAGRGELRFETRRWELQFAVNVVLLLAIGVVLWGILLVRRILGSVLAEQVFCLANVRRLWVLGWLFVGTGVLAPVVEYWRSWFVLRRTDVSGVQLAPYIDGRGDAILAGLLILVLARVWRYGVELQQDRDLTV